MALRGKHGEIEIEIKVSREELLERLKENREKHLKAYEKAIKCWQKELQSVLKTINTSDCVDFPYELEALRGDCPDEYLNEYDRAIDMFSMCVKKTITIDSESFNTFCRDEWGWKTYTVTNKYYRQTRVR